MRIFTYKIHEGILKHTTALKKKKNQPNNKTFLKISCVLLTAKYMQRYCLLIKNSWSQHYNSVAECLSGTHKALSVMHYAVNLKSNSFTINDLSFTIPNNVAKTYHTLLGMKHFQCSYQVHIKCPFKKTNLPSTMAHDCNLSHSGGKPEPARAIQQDHDSKN